MTTNQGASARTWQEIAADASKEKDSQKLMALTEELERAFEERDKALHPPTRKKSA